MFSFVSRNKYLLLNVQELNELSAISLKANIPEVEALVNTDRYYGDFKAFAALPR